MSTRTPRPSCITGIRSPFWSPWCCRRRPPTPRSTAPRRSSSASPTRRRSSRNSARRGSRTKIKTIGLYRNKARNLIALANKLVAEHGGKVPETREVLDDAARRRAEDRQRRAQHRLRPATRSASTPTPSASPTARGSHPARRRWRSSSSSRRVVPERYKHNAHHWLILHGRYVCKARKPECWRCIIEDICLFKPKTPAPGC